MEFQDTLGHFAPDYQICIYEGKISTGPWGRGVPKPFEK